MFVAFTLVTIVVKSALLPLACELLLEIKSRHRLLLLLEFLNWSITKVTFLALLRAVDSPDGVIIIVQNVEFQVIQLELNVLQLVVEKLQPSA